MVTCRSYWIIRSSSSKNIVGLIRMSLWFLYNRCFNFGLGFFWIGLVDGLMNIIRLMFSLLIFPAAVRLTTISFRECARDSLTLIISLMYSISRRIPLDWLNSVRLVRSIGLRGAVWVGCSVYRLSSVGLITVRLGDAIRLIGTIRVGRSIDRLTTIRLLIDRLGYVRLWCMIDRLGCIWLRCVVDWLRSVRLLFSMSSSLRGKSDRLMALSTSLFLLFWLSS